MDKINVFSTSDDNYAPYVSTTIASIMMHTNSYIDFYLIDCGISEINKKKIKEEEMIFDRLNIEFISIDTKKLFSDFPIMIHLSIAMYGKYLISSLKKDIDKIIYTDLDVAFVKDIKYLWDEPLDGYIMAAVPSQRYRLNDNYRDIKDELGIPQSHCYFMSGLMLIDCQKWRENKITEQLLSVTKRMEEYADQEVLNVVFTNNYKMLDVKYCVIHKIFKECYTKKEIKKYKNDQVIVHYPGGGKFKPWNNRFLKSAKYFNSTLRYTKFGKEIVKNQMCFTISKIKKAIFKHKYE